MAAVAEPRQFAVLLACNRGGRYSVVTFAYEDARETPSFSPCWAPCSPRSLSGPLWPRISNGRMTAMSGRWTPTRGRRPCSSPSSSNIYEPLARWNRDLKLEPALARAGSRPSPTVWRFHLRPNVKWQDGSPFTADDVVFSLTRILAKTSVMRAPMRAVKEVAQGGRPHGRFRDDASRTRSSCRNRPTSSSCRRPGARRITRPSPC